MYNKNIETVKIGMQIHLMYAKTFLNMEQVLHPISKKGKRLKNLKTLMNKKMNTMLLSLRGIKMCNKMRMKMIKTRINFQKLATNHYRIHSEQ